MLVLRLGRMGRLGFPELLVIFWAALLIWGRDARDIASAEAQV